MQAFLNARLLATMLVTLTLGFAVVDSYLALTRPDYHIPWYGYLILASAFLLNRFLSYRFAAVLACLMFPAVLFATVAVQPGTDSVRSLNHMVLGIMLAMMLLRRWEAVLYAVFCMGVILLVPALHLLTPDMHYRLTTPLATCLFGTVLSLTFTLHRDHLERRRREQLAASEKRFRDLVETTSDIIWEVDRDGRYRYVSPAVAATLGYAQSDMVGHSMFDFMAAAEATRLEAALRSALEDGSPMSRIGHRGRHRDGHDVVLESVGVPVVDENGAVAGYRGISRDVTERARAEELLQESEQRYRGFVANFRGIAYEVDEATFQATLFEGRVKEITGHEADEFLSGRRRWQDMVAPEDRPQAAAMAERMRNEPGFVADYEFRFRHADGGLRWARTMAHAVTDSRTQRRVLQGALFDITETKVLQERLRQSEKMDAVGQLASGIAHDFNNQLAAVVGFADVLRLDLGDQPELQSHVEGILTAARRASDLTGQLLAFARKGALPETDVDIHRVVQETVTLLQHSLDKRVIVKQRLRGGATVVHGDATQIQNALLNLGLNARDAMPSGGELTFATENVTLDEVFCRRSPFDVQPGVHVKVTVTDTGQGMDERVRKRLFEPFFTTKAEGKGVGMGLAAVYGTVKRHRGAIEVESQPGRGSAFTLYLPAVAGAGPAGAPAAPAAQPVSRHVRVLLVDDEELVLEMGLTVLRSLGHTATGAAGGAEALQKYQAAWREIDLVILDMVMPAMGGREVFDALRAVNPAVRVLLSSGYSLNGEAQRMLQDGAAGFVHKPYRQADLAAAIAEAVGG